VNKFERMPGRFTKENKEVDDPIIIIIPPGTWF